MSIDLAAIGRELKKPVENIEAAVKLLDDGNTIPFITRFRKDQTGGLTEEQLLNIKSSVAKLRALAERKSFIAKSIESQGKLTDEIKSQLEKSQTSRQLEDVYLAFKPKKQTLATVARQNGLEPLALDIFEARQSETDLATRATEFVRVDKNLNSVDDVIAGVGHILAEKFSDHSSLRNDLREIIYRGKISTKLLEVEPPPTTSDSQPPAQSKDTEEKTESAVDKNDPPTNATDNPTISAPDDITDQPNDAKETREQNSTEQAKPESAITISQPPKPVTTDNSKPAPDDATATTNAASAAKQYQPKKKKKKKKKKVDDPYKDYDDFSHPISNLPYHKTLAINRAEKNGRLKVRIQFDEDEVLKRANAALTPEDHAFKEFLHSCVKDAMSRLVVPSLEREIRREITEAAEKHAVQVFARNLKNLLLQSPVRDHRVLAIDPGYKRGCSVVVLDKSGQLLDNAHIFVVGNETRRIESKQKLVDLVNTHSVTLVAIGNGAACREAEQMVSDLISECFTDKKLKYAIVNEAGASFYSTSEVGREEFPDLSPAFRSAVSIGRRLIDPLSELVKISPANIGVGLYQHDVKAKHLAESLDDVVQFCVNRVGVDVNTASTSLLKYVSGLNQLTARRVYEYRKDNGPFKNREHLKEVAGFGDATFVQSAGFLRVRGGDQPLDTTAIHPEFYDIARKIIGRINGTVEELFPIATRTAAKQVSDAAEESKSENKVAAADIEPAADSEQSVDVESDQSTELAEAGENDGKICGSTDNASQVPDIPEKAIADELTIETTSEPEIEKLVENSNDIKLSKPKPENADGLTDGQFNRRKELVKAIRELDADALSKELGAGRLLLRDILQSICKPEYDPRNNVNRPVFRSGIIKLDDLKNDMCLDAQVVNVVDFGIFVDIGLGTSCLVHVSQLANHFIRDPYRFYAVGDSLRVWVTDVETSQRRVKLTAVQPQSLRPKRSSRPNRREQKRDKPFQKSKFKKSAGATGQKRFAKPRRKPKPVKPITNDMLAGEEPMRSFSDLAQFFDKKPGDEDKKE